MLGTPHRLPVHKDGGLHSYAQGCSFREEAGGRNHQFSSLSFTGRMSKGIPAALQSVNLLTKPHYYVITFVISEQTLYLPNPLCYRAAHPSLEQELTSKGIKRRRRLLKGSLGVSFYSCWLPPAFPFPTMCGILPHWFHPFLPARHWFVPVSF